MSGAATMVLAMRDSTMCLVEGGLVPGLPSRISRVYDANTDRNSVIVNTLIQPIKARFIRIYPETWNGHISMRMDLYGCEIQSDCTTPLGMENGHIPDSAITASSFWNAALGPNNVRIYHRAGGGRAGSWSAKTNEKGQWIQVNLGQIKEVTNVGTQGRQDYAQWVTKYMVSYSTDGQNFTVQNQEYIGNKDQNSLVINEIVQPIKAQYVRILPQEWHRHISMRMELYGCDPRAINGGYSEWGDWNQCSVTCGEGSRTRSRSCNNPTPQHGGADCSSLGPSQETGSCNEKPCPVDGGYGEWESWGDCSVTCGGGQRARSRKCNNPAPQHGGKDCKDLGPANETEDCNKNGCPVDGGYGEWGKWSECSKTCGKKKGSTTRVRLCDNPQPQNGGKDCTELGEDSETTSCKPKKKKCPVDGGYGTWSGWSTCTKTCGGGTQKRTRKCNKPKPKAGGKKCNVLGPNKETQKCNTESCAR
ncbi:hypothetical protein ACROYT_G038180 [Oculina patagonica]